METELSEFETNMKREIDSFMNPDQRRQSTPPRSSAPSQERQSGKGYKTGHLVKLAVRTKRLALDTVFEHQSSSISRLEAQMEAEKAAKKAGYPIIGHLVDIQRL
ncbi:hypothetical protein LG290_14950 [Halomonas sediminis]|uniref:Uncharacterized protein n=1 Tax=Vreelandella zhuhanensis TaxID=2684210 RepID=A0A7X3GZS5_9GAMM|nr:hypothetical protein [Halomonas zhuhanensis]MWJ27888.1 hypothetical protein [Halomonas zhuhanensis]